ncbi:hypothetical protein DV737_g2947, partial [Chaetothyriales sp. CBS 132003]
MPVLKSLQQKVYGRKSDAAYAKTERQVYGDNSEAPAANHQTPPPLPPAQTHLHYVRTQWTDSSTAADTVDSEDLRVSPNGPTRIVDNLNVQELDSEMSHTDESPRPKRYNPPFSGDSDDSDDEEWRVNAARSHKRSASLRNLSATRLRDRHYLQTRLTSPQQALLATLQQAQVDLRALELENDAVMDGLRMVRRRAKMLQGELTLRRIRNEQTKTSMDDLHAEINRQRAELDEEKKQIEADLERFHRRSVPRRRVSTQVPIDDQRRDDLHATRPLRISTQLVSSAFPRAQLQNDEDKGQGHDKASTVLLGRRRMQRESARYLCKAPAPAEVVRARDKAGARRGKTETDTAAEWADMPSELSGTSDTIRQLMIHLGLPHPRVSTPISLSNARRVRINDSSTETDAAKAAAATLQHDEAFFSPTTTNKPAEPAVVVSGGLKTPSSFHPQGAWGDIESLTDDTGSSLSVDPSLLHAPLPRNTVELLHEVADRCDREFARLRLNIRMMTEAEKKAEKEVVRLESELKIAKREQQKLLSKFAELVPQARVEAGSRPLLRETIGLPVQTDEGDIRLPSGQSGYEADLGDIDGADLKKAKKHGKKHARHLVPGAFNFEGAEGAQAKTL